MAKSQFYGKLHGRTATTASRLGTKDSGLKAELYTKTHKITVQLFYQYQNSNLKGPSSDICYFEVEDLQGNTIFDQGFRLDKLKEASYESDEN